MTHHLIALISNQYQQCCRIHRYLKDAEIFYFPWLKLKWVFSDKWIKSISAFCSGQIDCHESLFLIWMIPIENITLFWNGSVPTFFGRRFLNFDFFRDLVRFFCTRFFRWRGISLNAFFWWHLMGDSKTEKFSRIEKGKWFLCFTLWWRMTLE